MRPLSLQTVPESWGILLPMAKVSRSDPGNPMEVLSGLCERKMLPEERSAFKRGEKKRRMRERFDQRRQENDTEVLLPRNRRPAALYYRVATRSFSAIMRRRQMGLLDIIILILVLSWVGGFAVHVGGGLIHLLLLIALIMLVVRLAKGGRV